LKLALRRTIKASGLAMNGCRVLSYQRSDMSEAVMKAFAIILAVAVTAACSPALAQVVAPQATPQVTPNVVNPGGDLQLPLLSRRPLA
jgi:hypothetical protein